MNELQTVRTPEIIGAEIRHITHQIKYMTLYGGVEIGRRLKEAKEGLPYGTFGDFLKKETEFSSSAAGRFMQLYDEYGASVLGGGELFPTLGKVSVSNALRLLAIPSEEREEFVQEHNVEHLSARELDKIIAERDAALKRAEAAEKGLEEEKTHHAEALAPYEEQLSALRAENKELKERPIEVITEPDEEAVRKAAEEAKSKADAEWSKKLAAAKAAEAKSKKDAEKFEAQYKLAEAEAEKLRSEAASYDEAETDTGELEEEIASLRKQLAMSGAEITAFKIKFEEWQYAFQQMVNSLDAVPEETKGKLFAAVTAAFDVQRKALEREG